MAATAMLLSSPADPVCELQVIDFDLADRGRFDSAQRQAYSDARFYDTDYHEQAYGHDLPVVRLYTLDMAGVTRVLYIYDCAPFLYLGAPASGFVPEQHCAAVQHFLNSALEVQVIRVDYVDTHYDMSEYWPERARVLRVTVTDPNMVPRIRAFWFGEHRDAAGTVHQEAAPLSLYGMQFPRVVWEADVQFYRRVCLDARITPLSWIGVPQSVLDTAIAGQHIFVPRRRILPLGCSAKYARIAPKLRVAHWDIECLGRPGVFPSAERDPVISISIALYEGHQCQKPLDAVVFMTRCGGARGARPPPDTPVLEATSFRYVECANERQMLEAWATYLREVACAHVVGGYNIDGFDWGYVERRAQLLRCYGEVMRVSPWAPNELATLEKNRFQSKAAGKTDAKNVRIAGVLNVDLFRPIRREKKLRSYKLGAVSAEYLAKVDNRVVTKKDMPYQQIPDHYYGSEEQRWTLAEYNYWDAALCGKLIGTLQILNNLFAMARVTGVDVTELICGGQQVKVHMQLLADARDSHFLVPTRWRPPREPEPEPVEAPANETAAERAKRERAMRYDTVEVANQPTLSLAAAGAVVVSSSERQIKEVRKTAQRREEPEYEGATVIEPKRGFYTTPITTLDFSSLYPSIMIEHNLSHDTHVLRPQRCAHGHCMLRSAEVLQCCVTETPVGARFVKAHVREGILPRLLKRLLAERSAEKTAMAAAKDINDLVAAAVHDGMQLALKISANSIYGFTGASKGKCPRKEIGASVTAYGREMIERIKKLVERVFKPENGYAGVAEVVYGDSVTGDTPLVLLNIADNKIHITQICDIVALVGVTYNPWSGGKEQAIANGWKVWCSNGWTDLVRVIRHQAPGKRMMRILTHTGVADVTEDHSLLDANATKVRPCDVGIGSTLLHKPLPTATEIATDGPDTDEAFVWGFFMADGSCGAYDTRYGMKYTWALNKKNTILLNRAREILNRKHYPTTTFKILDTIQSSGVYKLVASGEVKPVVQKYRSLFYAPSKHKIVPNVILNASKSIREAFFQGYYAGDGDKDVNGYVRFDVKGKIGASGLFYLVTSLGYAASLNDRGDKLDVFRVTCCRAGNSQRKPETKVKRIRELESCDASTYVYDVETVDHTFAVGPGKMVVHNTDSIMVKFGVSTVAEAIDYGKRAAVLINADFKSRNLSAAQCHSVLGQIEESAAAGATVEALREQVLAALTRAPAHVAPLIMAQQAACAINIVFEKALDPYLLINKKRYAGGFWLDAKAVHHIHQSGIESVRRDNSLFTCNLINDVVTTLMTTRSLERALELARMRVHSLARGRIAFDDLVVSKGYTKNVKDYADGHKLDEYKHYRGSQPHLRVNAKLEKRGEQTYKLGERIPYVLVEPRGKVAMEGKRRKVKQEDLVEHPDYAKRIGLKPNADYYLRHQAMKPLTRIFDTALGEGATAALVFERNLVSVATGVLQDSEAIWQRFVTEAARDGIEEEKLAAKINPAGQMERRVAEWHGRKRQRSIKTFFQKQQ